MTGKRVLYLSYDGMTDPLGRSQVLPYLAGLAAMGHDITILSCEKPRLMGTERSTVVRLCEAAGLKWRPLTYHKRPPILSTVWDVLRMEREARKLQRQSSFDLVHCRSYIPAVVGVDLKRRYGTRFLFDMRGFWPEEKVEGGHWNMHNPLFRAVYRFFKRKEAECLAEADQVVTLTDAARNELTTKQPKPVEAFRITVIPCCVDFGHFGLGDARVLGRCLLGLSANEQVLVYVGSLGGSYMLNEMLDFFRAFREARSGARFLFVTREPEQMIVAEASARGLAREELIIRSATRDEVPALIAAGDLGIAFKQPSFSAKGCSPTKVGEMLAMGLPVVANSGVGDVDATIEPGATGAIVHSFTPDAYRDAIGTVGGIALDREGIREAARRRFDLEDGVKAYDEIYRSLSRSGRRACGG